MITYCIIILICINITNTRYYIKGKMKWGYMSTLLSMWFRPWFNDSEEEITTKLNDGFEVIEVDRPKDGSNIVEIKRNSYRINVCATKSPTTKLTSKKKMKLIAPAAVIRVLTSKDFKRND